MASTTPDRLSNCDDQESADAHEGALAAVAVAVAEDLDRSKSLHSNNHTTHQIVHPHPTHSIHTTPHNSSPKMRSSSSSSSPSPSPSPTRSRASASRSPTPPRAAKRVFPSAHRRNRSRSPPRRSATRSRSPAARSDRHRRRSRSRSPRDHPRSPRRGYSPRGKYSSRRSSPPSSRGRRGRSPFRRKPWSPPPNRNNGVGEPGNNLFVAGFHFITTERDLERKFSKYGRVTEVRIVRDKRSGESRGFGFLTLEKDKDADAAIEALDQIEWNGRIVLVEKAKTTTHN